MRIEVLKSDDAEHIVGITEILNSNKLTRDELIDLAQSISDDTLVVQLMNGLLIADDIHLLSAVQNAVNAQNGEYMLSRSLDVEIIVYASAQRQIGKALEALGVNDALKNIAVVVVGINRKQVEKALEEITKNVGTAFSESFEASAERFEHIRKHFKIDETEIGVFTDSNDIHERQKALSKCVVSRVSLVAIDT
ncbi:MAG: KEOPS complex subunit Cgi121 [Candidatus Thorarchaeota archaeon]